MNPVYEQFTDGEYLRGLKTETLDEMGMEFRNAFGYPTGWTPMTLDDERVQQHIQMIRDEFEKELIPALEAGDIVEIYDAGIDVMVYIQNLLGEMGLPLAPGFREVFLSNMTKLDPTTGKAIKAVKNDPSGAPEGKTLKGPNYVKPQFEKLIGIFERNEPLFYVTPFDDIVGDDEVYVRFTCTLCKNVDYLTSKELSAHARNQHHILSPNAWVVPNEKEVVETNSFMDASVIKEEN